MSFLFSTISLNSEQFGSEVVSRNEVSDIMRPKFKMVCCPGINHHKSRDSCFELLTAHVDSYDFIVSKELCFFSSAWGFTTRGLAGFSVMLAMWQCSYTSVTAAFTFGYLIFIRCE